MKPGWADKWRRVKMELLDQEFIDVVELGYVQFRCGRRGPMRFGVVNLAFDWKTAADDRAEFTFEGFDEGDEVSGHGWARVVDRQLTGEIAFHQGDRSGYVAKPWRWAKAEAE